MSLIFKQKRTVPYESGSLLKVDNDKRMISTREFFYPAIFYTSCAVETIL